MASRTSWASSASRANRDGSIAAADGGACAAWRSLPRWPLLAALVACVLIAHGCGGDNLDLCDGCANATATPTTTATSILPSSTPTPDLGSTAFGIATPAITPGV